MTDPAFVEQCLWVRDTILTNRHKMPHARVPRDRFRCHRGGLVFCTPCGKALFGPTWGDEYATTS